MSRYRFIAQQRRTYPVQRLCAVLQVSTSGFYEWLKRQPSRRAEANGRLSAHIRAIHQHSRQTYGYLRVHAELRAGGEVVGKHRVARLMRQMGLQTKGRRGWRSTTQADKTHRRAPNLLKGDFKATRPNDTPSRGRFLPNIQTSTAPATGRLKTSGNPSGSVAVTW